MRGIILTCESVHRAKYTGYNNCFSLSLSLSIYIYIYYTLRVTRRPREIVLEPWDAARLQEVARANVFALASTGSWEQCCFGCSLHNIGRLFIVLAPFLASKAPGCMKNLFWNHHRNPRTPKGDSRTPRSRTSIQFWGLIFIVFRILGCLEGSLAQVWKRMPKRSETILSETLKIVFSCTREHSFHLRRAAHTCAVLVHIWLHWGSRGDALLRFTAFCLGCFFWTGFMSE